jgi:hypothetical protein
MPYLVVLIKFNRLLSMFDMFCHEFAQKTLVKISNHGQTLDLL